METYDDAAMGGAIAGMLGTIFLVFGIFLLVMLVCNWKIYTKAGKPGWACLVPIYNIVVLLDIVKTPTWWIILLIIPGVNFIVALIITHRLSKAFGQDLGFTLGLIFLGFVFYPLLAFGNYRYQYAVTEDAGL